MSNHYNCHFKKKSRSVTISAKEFQAIFGCAFNFKMTENETPLNEVWNWSIHITNLGFRFLEVHLESKTCDISKSHWGGGIYPESGTDLISKSHIFGRGQGKVLLFPTLMPSILLCSNWSPYAKCERGPENKIDLNSNKSDKNPQNM